MLPAFTLALAQLGDRRILSVLGKSVALTLVVFLGLGALSWLGLGPALAWAGLDAGSGLAGDGLRALLAVVLTLLAGWLLFRLIALAVLQLFADEVVAAVEARHYPAAAATARKLGLAEEVRNGLRGLIRALLYNLAALPVALLVLPTAIGPAVVFGLVNAVLLGRELSDMVALRHAGLALPGALTRAALGGVMVVLLTVPLINLLAPVIGAAMATHLVHRRKKVP